MGLPNGQRHALGIFRHRDKMNMVVHQAIGPKFESVLVRMPAKKAEVDLPVLIAEKNGLPAVSPVGDMVRAVDGDNALKGRHLWSPGIAGFNEKDVPRFEIFSFRGKSGRQ